MSGSLKWHFQGSWYVCVRQPARLLVTRYDVHDAD